MTVCERSAPADSKTSTISPGDPSSRPGWIMRGAPETAGEKIVCVCVCVCVCVRERERVVVSF